MASATGRLGDLSGPAILKAIGEMVDIGGDLFARRGLMQPALWRINEDRCPHWFRYNQARELIWSGLFVPTSWTDWQGEPC